MHKITVEQLEEPRRMSNVLLYIAYDLGCADYVDVLMQGSIGVLQFRPIHDGVYFRFLIPSLDRSSVLGLKSVCLGRGNVKAHKKTGEISYQKLYEAIESRCEKAVDICIAYQRLEKHFKTNK